jgi:hypothetical protein
MPVPITTPSPAPTANPSVVQQSGDMTLALGLIELQKQYGEIFLKFQDLMKNPNTVEHREGEYLQTQSDNPRGPPPDDSNLEDMRRPLKDLRKPPLADPELEDLLRRVENLKKPSHDDPEMDDLLRRLRNLRKPSPNDPNVPSDEQLVWNSLSNEVQTLLERSTSVLREYKTLKESADANQKLRARQLNDVARTCNMPHLLSLPARKPDQTGVLHKPGEE